MLESDDEWNLLNIFYDMLADRNLYGEAYQPPELGIFKGEIILKKDQECMPVGKKVLDGVRFYGVGDEPLSSPEKRTFMLTGTSNHSR